MEGRDDWLFLTGLRGQDHFVWYRHPETLSQTVFRRMAATHRRRRADLAALGIPFVAIAPPDPAFLVPKKLPPGVRFDPANGPYRRLARELSAAERADFVYPLETIRKAHHQRPAYPPDDFHWTAWGAYAGYRALMARVRRHLPAARTVEAGDIRWRDGEALGLLGAQVPGRRAASVPIADCASAAAQRRDTVRTEGGLSFAEFDGGDPALPTAVMFRGSFTVAMLPFLIRSFRRLILIRCGNRMLFDVIVRERPDIVILERAEFALVPPVTDNQAVDEQILFGDLRCQDLDEAAAELDVRRLLHDGDHAAAADKAAMVASRWPQSATHHYFRAVALNAAGRRDEAAMACRDALSRDGRLAAGYELLGDIARAQGQPDDALGHYLRVIDLVPKAPRPWLLAARVSRFLGRPAQAAVQVRAGLAVAPDDPALHAELATILLEAGRLAEAHAEVSQALHLDDGVMAFWQLAARICFKLRHWAEAVGCLERFAALSPNGEGFIAPFLAAARQAAAINCS
ncbi:hypothetical protein D3874_08270 [Oleomonas cavernae]|uniref:AlgX/AlgJ SGNH hydrolase-like domain-containing protein n=2 Tax=Oleomonas cavernae TaxID=2320859 RepID=A0A418WAI9_9PROT|nr:hypothetical protein D3874_08270 [Oleomonas cavernae]